MNVHESKILNALLGKRVKIIFWDNSEACGTLKKSTIQQGYAIENLHFRKSHVKKVFQI